MSLDMPPPPEPKPPAVVTERFKKDRNGSTTRLDQGPTASQVIQALRDSAKRAEESTARVTDATPADGSTTKLRSDSRAIRRLREMRDRRD